MCLQYLCQQLEDVGSLCKVNSHVLNDDQRAMCLLLTVTHLQHGRNEGNVFLHRILTTDESRTHSFYPQMKWQNAEWHTTNSSWKKSAHHSPDALKVLHILFFSQNGLVLDHPVPVGTIVNGQYYCSLLQDKERATLQSKELKLLWCDVILLRNKANLVQCWGWEMLAYSPYSTDLAPCDYCLFACEGTSSEKTIWIGRRYQHCCHWLFTLSEQGWTQICKLIIYHVDGKSVWTSLVVTMSRGYMNKHSRTSIM